MFTKLLFAFALAAMLGCTQVHAQYAQTGGTPGFGIPIPGFGTLQVQSLIVRDVLTPNDINLSTLTTECLGNWEPVDDNLPIVAIDLPERYSLEGIANATDISRDRKRDGVMRGADGKTASKDHAVLIGDNVYDMQRDADQGFSRVLDLSNYLPGPHIMRDVTKVTGGYSNTKAQLLPIPGLHEGPKDGTAMSGKVRFFDKFHPELYTRAQLSDPITFSDLLYRWKIRVAVIHHLITTTDPSKMDLLRQYAGIISPAAYSPPPTQGVRSSDPFTVTSDAAGACYVIHANVQGVRLIANYDHSHPVFAKNAEVAKKYHMGLNQPRYDITPPVLNAGDVCTVPLAGISLNVSSGNFVQNWTEKGRQP